MDLLLTTTVFTLLSASFFRETVRFHNLTGALQKTLATGTGSNGIFTLIIKYFRISFVLFLLAPIPKFPSSHLQIPINAL